MTQGAASPENMGGTERGTDMLTFKQKYNASKKYIIEQKNIKRGIASLIYNYDPDKIKKITYALCGEAFFRKGVSGYNKPGSFADIGKSINMPPFPDLRRSLLWYTLDLISGSGQINAFLSLKSRYDHEFLRSNYEMCDKLLEECNKGFGWSLWEIENRIALLSERDGFDAQKKYVDSLVDEVNNKGINVCILNCQSMLCEQRANISTYLKRRHDEYNRLFAKVDDSRLFMYEYVKYRTHVYLLDDSGKSKIYSDPGLLNMFLFQCQRNALIDRYLIFSDIVADVFSVGDDKLRQEFLPYVVDLSGHIHDMILVNTAFYQKNGYYAFYPEGSENIRRAFDMYSAGDYEGCMEIARELLNQSEIYFPLVQLCAKCLIYLGKEVTLTEDQPIIERIIQKLKQRFSRSSNIDEVQADLIKILSTHLSSNWAKELLTILSKVNSHFLVLEETGAAVNYSAVTTPDILFDFPAANLDGFISQLPEPFADSVSIRFSMAVRKKDLGAIKELDIDEVRKSRYSALILLDKDPNAAIELLNSIKGRVKVGALSQEVDALLVNAYLRTGDLLSAMDLFVHAFYDNVNFTYIGCTDQIFQKIKSGKYSINSSIFAPLVCAIYFNHYLPQKDRDDVVWHICYDEYLEYRGVKKPTELIDDPPGDVSDLDLTHFLAEVCVPNVMDRSLAFDSYDEVLNERISICETLVKRDPNYADKYADEAKRLNNSLLVRLAKKKVENSKVYIDTEGLRVIIYKNVCEDYERYVDYEMNSIKYIMQLFDDNDSDNFGLENFHLKLFSAREMLSAIIKQTRDIFVADNRYGLDGCLSVRIRHGTLESQLRSCFERHKLVTAKDVGGQYRSNNYWYVDGQPRSETRSKVDQIFSQFSAKVDEIILHLKRDVIQIKTEKKNPQGLFDFTINDYFIDDAYSKSREYYSFDDLVSDLLQTYLVYTNNSLSAVRSLLVDKIDKDFQRILNELELQIRGINSKHFSVAGLRAQIASARTDISTELNNISEWFRLTQPDSFSDYGLSIAVSISREIMNYSHSNRTVDITEEIDQSIILQGRTMPNIVEIFKILIDNVIKHSGVDGKLAAAICATREKDKIVITMKNPVKPNKIDHRQIREVEDRLRAWENQDYTSREGGSGLYKIKKLISVDLGCGNNIKIKCSDDSFSVQIEVETRGILV